MVSQTRILFASVSFMAIILWPQGDLRADDKRGPTVPVTEAQKDLVTSPAYQIYNATMLDCFKVAVGVDPVEAARKGDKDALNMDRSKILKMQDCMKEKGVNADFENYYGGKRQNENPAEMSAAQKADIDAIQAKLDAAEPPVVPRAAVPVSVPTPSMPARSIAPPPQAIAPAPVPVPEEQADKPDDSGAGTVKSTTQQRQYWVKPAE